MSTTIKTEGFAELREALLALPGEVSQKFMTRALRKGAKVVHAQAVATAPYDSKRKTRKYGHLKDQLKITTSNKENMSVASVESGDAYWAIMLEWGTKTRAPHPFLTKALETTADEAIEEISESLASDIEKSFEEKTKG